MKIYSFDVSVDNPVIDVLQNLHQIETTPSMIISGKKHEGYLDANDLEEYIQTKIFEDNLLMSQGEAVN